MYDVYNNDFGFHCICVCVCVQTFCKPVEIRSVMPLSVLHAAFGSLYVDSTRKSERCCVAHNFTFLLQEEKMMMMQMLTQKLMRAANQLKPRKEKARKQLHP